jgi:hypothetical protein
VHYILFRIIMDNSKLQIWSGSNNDLLTTLCHVTLQSETLNVWIEPSSMQIFTRQNSKYHFLNTETGGNLSTEAIPSAECNKSRKIYSNMKDMFYKNTIFLIPNKIFLNFSSFMNLIHYLCLSVCPNLRTLETLNELSWSVVSGSFANINYKIIVNYMSNWIVESHQFSQIWIFLFTHF